MDLEITEAVLYDMPSEELEILIARRIQDKIGSTGAKITDPIHVTIVEREL